MSRAGGERVWRAGAYRLPWGRRPLVMGILNATPDSFYDGDACADAAARASRGRALFEEGADIVDVGGESTRPGHRPVGEAEERERVLPAIEALSGQGDLGALSVDTSKASVAEAALRAGACIVNDVWGFRKDSALAEIVAAHGAGCVLMHNARGDWGSGGGLDAVKAGWEASLEIARRAGIPDEAIVLDPGIGFGTTREEDLKILRGIGELRAFGFPVLVGVSRKRVTGAEGDLPAEGRLETTLAASAIAAFQGAAIHRVHDVAANVRAVRMAALIAGRG